MKYKVFKLKVINLKRKYKRERRLNEKITKCILKISLNKIKIIIVEIKLMLNYIILKNNIRSNHKYNKIMMMRKINNIQMSFRI
jgi:hypothetical protein